LNACPERPARAVVFSPRLPEPAKTARRRPDMILRASLPVGKQTRHSRLRVSALWMTPRTVRETSRTVAPHMIWWLPPVIWQNEEHLWRRLIAEARRNGACRFVAGAPWQAGLFADGQAELIAGPFCNAANAMTLNALSALGFSAAFVSPELSREDLLRLPRRSPLPLGAFIAGFWPVGISRHASSVHQNELFSGPGREQFWTHVYGQNTWIYPAWPIDLAGQRQELEAAGYVFFAEMEEHPPRNMPENKRPGLFNWETGLL
jgi:putative protease